MNINLEISNDNKKSYLILNLFAKCRWEDYKICLYIFLENKEWIFSGVSAIGSNNIFSKIKRKNSK